MLGAVGVAVLGLVLGACGGGSDGSMGVVADAGATTSATTARVRTTTIGAADATPVSLYSTGLVDFATGDASAVMATDGDGPSSAMEARTVRGQTYLRIQGGSWLPAASAPNAVDYPPALAALSGSGALGGGVPDSTRWLAALGDLGDVHVEGHPRIDGVATTKYGGTFELRPARAKDGARREPKGPGDLDVWIDGAGRVRRLVVAIPSRHGPVLVRTDLTDFGVPVHVTAPSPSEVLHITPLPEGT